MAYPADPHKKDNKMASECKPDSHNWALHSRIQDTRYSDRKRWEKIISKLLIPTLFGYIYWEIHLDSKTFIKWVYEEEWYCTKCRSWDKREIDIK